MFYPGHWAMAFVNTLERDHEDGFETLKLLASWVTSLHGEVFGRAAASKIEKLIREAAAGVTLSAAQETAIRFVVLMVKKSVIRHAASVIAEIKKLLDRKNNVLAVSLESALPAGKEFEERVKEVLTKQTGAARVEITGKINPRLIGGYRLRIEDKIIDASILSQLRRMEARLSAVHGGV